MLRPLDCERRLAAEMIFSSHIALVAVPWEINELTVGWPPSVKLTRRPGEEQALHPLFVILEDKRLLRYGYGPISGIVELSDLASRIDAIRDTIRPALAALEPDAPSAVWLEKLGTACQQLLTETYRAMSVRDVAPEASDVAPAVNQLRQLFATVASEVWEVYELPAARNLAVHIHDDIGRSDAWERGHE